MLPEVPWFVAVLFTLTTLYAVWLFKTVFKPDKVAWTVLFLWLITQAYLAYVGFYEINDTLPPRFALVLFPALLVVLYLVYIKGVNITDVEALHRVHTVRIPVEIVLWLLAGYQVLPELLTFEGRNFDIIAGLTAPLIILYGLRKQIIDRQRIILWNFIGLFLLGNIVVTAILSVESPLQQFGFETPNRAVLTFPYVWLPAFIVPLVLFAHLQSIKILVKNED
ncbi:hypothetical protein [Jiulongibacter sp. NS-SX5]|uniref:hypothetical protein n=1 Tax=Jiulongibacter sp. NS-SX5 TaxID=3463854 RepID=UPI004059099B